MKNKGLILSRSIKLKIILGSDIILLGLVIWGYIVFLRMYFNGFSMVFYINRYGEANLEMVIIPLLIVVHSLGIFFLWCLHEEDRKKKSS